MFGLTRREQRWKAEQQAGELLVAIGIAAIQAKQEIVIAKMRADDVAELRAEVVSLRQQLAALTDTSKGGA